jgi:AraC family L-rhamnose operon transcriptional activator RhaR
MKNYRPLLLQNFGLALPSLRVHRLRLNHHMPEPVWTTHAHDHGQLLIYLSGRGKQQMGDRAYDCRPGSVLFVPPGQTHAFSRQMQRAPMVLVIDLDLESTRATAHPCALMPQADLTRVRASLTKLLAIRSPDLRESMLAVAAIILEILDRALLAAGWLKPFNRFGDSRPVALTKFTERLLERMSAPEITLEQIARHAGYDLEALNRKLKSECGLTLGQLRSRLRLQRAQTLIRQGWPMQSVAGKVGMPDNNYFSRWFRRQTGMTPSQFRKSPQQVVRL